MSGFPCASCAHPERCSYAGCARDTAWLCETSAAIFPNTAPVGMPAPCAGGSCGQGLPVRSSLTAAGVASAVPAGSFGEVRS